MSWSEAFSKARLVEEEGDVMVEDFIENEKRVKAAKAMRREEKEEETNTSASATGATDEAEELRKTKKHKDKHSREEGGFQQPKALALFAQAQKEVEGEGQEPKADKALKSLLDERDAEKGKKKKIVDDESLGRQICRKWLKHAYLGLGQGCNANAEEGKEGCKRAHAVPSKISEIYNDYSFKGLPAPHRKKILAKLEEGKKGGGE